MLSGAVSFSTFDCLSGMASPYESTSPAASKKLTEDLFHAAD